MHEPDRNLQDLDMLREAVLSKDKPRIKQWFESHAFSAENQGEVITTISSASKNELVNLLVEAVITHHDEAFSIMLQYTGHASVLYHAKDIDDRTLVQVILTKGSLLCLKILIQYGYDINFLDLEGMTPLMYLIYKKSVSRVKEYKEKLDFIIQNGGDVNKQGRYNWAFASLHIAVLYSAGTKTVKALIDGGADLNLRCNNSQSSPLHFAVERVSPEMADLLLENGADPSVMDILGDTPLHIAAVQPGKTSSLLKVFIKWNISMEIENTYGQSPLIWILSDWKTARKNRIQMLLKAGSRCSKTKWFRIRKEESVDPKLECKLTDIEALLDFYAFRPRSLHDLVCFKIREILGRDLPRLVPRLPIPECLKKRVNLEHYFVKHEN